MKKNASPAIPEKTEKRGAFYQAGEIIGSIGFHLVDGKDKVIGAVSEEFNSIKKVIKEKLRKKSSPESKEKKVLKKKLTGKTDKKIKGGVKKPANKAKPTKTVSKKAKKAKNPAKSEEGQG